MDTEVTKTDDRSHKGEKYSHQSRESAKILHGGVFGVGGDKMTIKMTDGCNKEGNQRIQTDSTCFEGTEIYGEKQGKQGGNHILEEETASKEYSLLPTSPGVHGV